MQAGGVALMTGAAKAPTPPAVAARAIADAMVALFADRDDPEGA